MIVDLQDFMLNLYDSGIKLKQKELCEIIDVNRYTVSMIFNKWDGIYRNMKPDSAYRLNERFPEFFPLPDDFCHYSTASLLITAKMNGLDMAGLSKMVKMSQHTLSSRLNRSSSYFIYDDKGFFKNFDVIYVPTLNGEFASKKPKEMSFEEFEKQLKDKCKKKNFDERKTKAEWFTNGIMYNVGLLHMQKAFNSVKSEFDIDDEQIYGLFCSCFEEKYGVKEIR